MEQDGENEAGVKGDEKKEGDEEGEEEEEGAGDEDLNVDQVRSDEPGRDSKCHVEAGQRGRHDAGC